MNNKLNEYDIPLRVAVAGNVNSGKCLGKNTPVLMFNGKTKMIQDIQEGDLVMGDDSNYRKVISTTHGKDIMYKIKMKKGGEYIINSHHILSLRRANIESITIDNSRKAYICKWWEGVKYKYKRIYWEQYKNASYVEAHRYLKEVVPNLKNYTPGNSIIDISIKDYLALSKHIQNKLYGYKTKITFPYQHVDINPYLLGTCLGKSYKPTITNRYISTFDNEHIPDEYKYNSSDIQLQILAGVMDTIGYYINGKFKIIIKNKQLIQDLQFICRSLGFWTTIHENYQMFIVGNLEQVPTRKQVAKCLSKDEHMVSAIRVTKMGIDDYYGISLKGSNLRFLLGDFTVTHNSSLLGVLKSGIFDDGNGKSRACIFNYPHERKTGRTSSVAQRSIVVNDKRILFFDMAGHEKYLRTTLFGMSSSYPDIALILIEANKELAPNKSHDPNHVNFQFNRMTKEHIITCIYFNIPMVFVFTKIDMVKDNPKIFNNNLKHLKSLLRSQNIQIYRVKSKTDITLAKKIIGTKMSPVFTVSNVKGNDINPPFHYLMDFLHSLNTKKVIEQPNETNMFIADKSFKVTGFPLIASGYMISGRISVNDKLFMGPVNGKYLDVTIRSLHDDHQNIVSFLRKDEMGCIAFKVKGDAIKNKKHVRAGMIFTTNKRSFVREFIGKVTIFSHHSTTIKRGCNTMIHCGAIKQAVVIENIMNIKGKTLSCIRGGDVAYVKFRFLKEKYYVEEGEIFVFREGNTRGSGEIKKIIIDE